MKITDVSVVVHERKLPAGTPVLPMNMAVLRILTDEEGDIDWDVIKATQLAEVR